MVHSTMVIGGVSLFKSPRIITSPMTIHLARIFVSGVGPSMSCAERHWGNIRPVAPAIHTLTPHATSLRKSEKMPQKRRNTPSGQACRVGRMQRLVFFQNLHGPLEDGSYRRVDSVWTLDEPAQNAKWGPTAFPGASIPYNKDRSQHAGNLGLNVKEKGVRR